MGFSSLPSVGKRECPGLLSRGDLGPVHYHCPTCFLSYKLGVVRGLGQGPVESRTCSGGGGKRWAKASSNTWATSFSSSMKARNSTKMYTFMDLQRKWDESTNSFCSLSLFFENVLHFFVLFLCVGSQIQFCRSLNRHPQIMSGICSDSLMPQYVQCQVMVD